MPIAVDVPVTGTPTHTAGILGQLHRELIAEGIELDVVQEIVKRAAAELLPFGVVLKGAQV